MVIKRSLRQGVWALAVAATFGLTSTAEAQRHHHHHRGGIGPGGAVALGLGSFALGTAIGSGGFARPWGPHPYGYYAPAPVYHAPPPAYAHPGVCWYPQFGGYYAC